MGCTSSKPIIHHKRKGNPNQVNDPYRPPRVSTRHAHPSAHPPDSLPYPHDQAGILLPTYGAGTYWAGTYVAQENPLRTTYDLSPSGAAAMRRQRDAARLRDQCEKQMNAKGRKDGAWRNGAQHVHTAADRTSRSKGRSKGWMKADGYPAPTSRTSETENERQYRAKLNQAQVKKPGNWLKHRHPPYPEQPQCKPMHTIPRKPVPMRSTPKPVASSKASWSSKKPQPSKIIYQAPNQSRFPPAPGPPPNRPLPLLLIAQTQQGSRQGRSQQQQQYPVIQQSFNPTHAYPPRPGPPRNISLPSRPLVSPIMGSTTRFSTVSSLGPEPERVFPHVPRATNRR